MTGTRAPYSVALVDNAEVQRFRLCSRLEQKGYMPVLFAGVADLLAALTGGRRFELLLFVEGDTSAWDRLSAVCSVLGMPVLLLIQDLHWKARMAPAHDFLTTPLFDFAFLSGQDAELDTRMHTLIQRGRAGEHQAAQDREITVIGDYEFLEGADVVLHQGREIQLQPRQFALALELFRSVGSVVTREWLWNAFWGSPPPRDGARALDVCVANVRRKLDLRAENGFTLRAVYKRGYQLRAMVPRSQARTHLVVSPQGDGAIRHSPALSPPPASPSP